MGTTFKTYEPTAKRAKSNEEDTLQADCFDYWNKYYRKVSVLFSVPNGQKRNYAEAAIALHTGLTAGVADLILLLPDARTVFFELKAAKGSQKPGQKIFEANVLRLRFPYHLIRTFEQFTTHLTALLGPPNEKASSEDDDQGVDQETRDENPDVKEAQGRQAQASRPNRRRNQEVPSGRRNR